MDERGYIELSEGCMPMLYRTAYGILRSTQDAEDATQQALLNAWRYRDRVKPGAERAWITRILINECRNIQRRRMKSYPVADIPEGEAPQDMPEDNGLRAAIDALPDSLRTPFLLKYMEEMTAKDIAAAMRLPVASVKNRLFRARKALQKTLKEEAATV